MSKKEKEVKDKNKAEDSATPVKAEPKKKIEAIVTVQQQPDTNPQSLMALALTQGASPEVIGKFMDLQDRWEAKQSKKAFDAAMADFQMECPVIKKGKMVKDNSGKILYSYAPIDSIVVQVKDIIQKHGFSYQVKTGERASMLFATCIVKHKAGHAEETTFEVPLGTGTAIMSGPQKHAASLTFAKRYAFCNAFGIMTGNEDTDAVTSLDDKKNTLKKTDASVQQKFEQAMTSIDGCEEPSTLEKWKMSFGKLKEFSTEQKSRFVEKANAKITEIQGRK